MLILLIQFGFQAIDYSFNIVLIDAVIQKLVVVLCETLHWAGSDFALLGQNKDIQMMRRVRMSIFLFHAGCCKFIHLYKMILKLIRCALKLGSKARLSPVFSTICKQLSINSCSYCHTRHYPLAQNTSMLSKRYIHYIV
jgi:hypothetical protein